MQVIECKPAFVPDELFISGINPHKDGQTRGKASPPAGDSSRVSVVSNTPDPIPGLETTE